eukprot:m.15654 g.15654  ORF g.15654 m.15654 type:complete len:464 (+) comp10790_c0_seq1:423-1814(+)
MQGCALYNASASLDRAGDMLPFGDTTVLLLGIFFAAVLVGIQTFVYLAHLWRMYHIKDDPHGEEGMNVQSIISKGSVDSNCCTTCCLYDVCLQPETMDGGQRSRRQECCGVPWTPPFVAMSTSSLEKESDYTIAGNIFNENLRISPTMSEFSTNSMRGNQTLLAVCVATSVGLSLLIGFNRLLLTRHISKFESDLHIVVAISYMSLVLVGLFPSNAIHKVPLKPKNIEENNTGNVPKVGGTRFGEAVYEQDSDTELLELNLTDTSNDQELLYVKRRQYNLILCCGCNWTGLSAVLHVVGSLTYLFVPVAVKIYVNRDGGSRCYGSRLLFLHLLYATLIVNSVFLIAACCAPAALCGPMMSGCATWFAAKFRRCCNNTAKCLRFLAIFWNPNGEKCCAQSCMESRPTRDQLKSTRKSRKCFLMSVFTAEMAAFFLTSFVYFIVELWTFYYYTRGRFITPKYVNV